MKRYMQQKVLGSLRRVTNPRFTVEFKLLGQIQAPAEKWAAGLLRISP